MSIPKDVSASFIRRNPHLYPKFEGEVQSFASEPKGISIFTAPPTVSRSREFKLQIEPCPAPRMTRSDKWRGQPGAKPRRPAVQRYFDFRDAIRAAVGPIDGVPDEIFVMFNLSMPDSWSKKKKLDTVGKPHRSRPDNDNMMKAVKDALFEEDGAIWQEHATKRWTGCGQGFITLTMLWH